MAATLSPHKKTASRKSAKASKRTHELAAVGGHRRSRSKELERSDDPSQSASDDSSLDDQKESRRAAAELPPHLARLVATPLLSAEREQDLFRRMNLLQRQASERVAAIGKKTGPKRAARLGAEADQMLAEAREIRDSIVQANVRLVMWVVKRFAAPRRPFDDLLSDGLVTLMKAVQKFDCERGVRFSTYACRALVSNTCRSIASETKRRQKFAPWSDLAGETALAREELSELAVGADGVREAFSQMVDRLDEREKTIICGRFAVGPVDRVITRESLANDLGVSKERVRQLQQRALGKLQEIAVEMKLDSLL